MALRSIVLGVFLLAFTNFAAGDGKEPQYCYKSDTTNCIVPPKWPALCTNGPRQSPVNFNQSLYKCYDNATMTTLIFSKECSELQQFKLTNEKYKVKMDLDKPCLITGTLVNNETMKCSEIFFHWGTNKSDGTEHRFTGDAYAMEAQICCHNTKYANLAEALKLGQRGAVRCIALLFRESGSSDNTALEAIISHFPDIKKNGTTTRGSRLNVTRLMSIGYNRGKFDCLRYLGSLTFPCHGNCSEIVEWCIRRVTDYISTTQMKDVRELMAPNGELITNNCRETQRNFNTYRDFQCCRMYPVIEGKEREGSTVRPGLFHRLPKVPIPKPNLKF